MENYSIIIDSVSKRFSSGVFRKEYTQALDSVSLQIKQGEIFGLLGPNGAGKTTLLNILSTQLIADTGEIQILGKSLNKLVTREQTELKTRLNMCSGNPNFPWSMNIEELLNFYAMLYGFSRSKRKEIIDRCIILFELENYRNRKYNELSTGTKQKLALAKSLINNPEILFLDEPTIGLDPNIARKIRLLIKDIHQQKNITIILTTHYMKEAEELCERIAFIKDGRIKAVGTKEELESMTNTTDLEGVFLELVD